MMYPNRNMREVLLKDFWFLYIAIILVFVLVLIHDNQAKEKLDTIIQILECPESKPVTVNGEFVGCVDDEQKSMGYYKGTPE